MQSMAVNIGFDSENDVNEYKILVSTNVKS